MENKALYSLSYGVFLLAVKSGEKVNACITNTCMQAANDPVRLALTVISKNYTCDILKEGGEFTLSILDQTVPFETIAHFGYQSGRNVDKMKGWELPTAENGIPYLASSACAVLCGKVVSQVDLGTHTLFVAEVTDAKLLGTQPPLTYAYYQENVKPKAQAQSPGKAIKGWRCKICGYVYEGSTLPNDFTCPRCGHGAEDFEPIYE